MTSAKRARLARWLEGDGIEIGALHRPLAVPEGAHVRYVDHLTEADLRAHYPELAGLPLTPVSVIGSAEDLSAFADSSLDFVIANHLLEHLEYPLRGLLEFQRVLKPGGLLYLALPDKRVTFDRDRELTTTDHLMGEHLRSDAEKNRRDHYLDWSVNVDEKEPGAEAEAHADDLMRRAYSIHFHVWRPDTFLDFLARARTQGELDLAVLQFSALEFDGDDEFCLLLAKGPVSSRRLPPSAVQADARSDTSPPPADPVPASNHVAVASEPSLRRRVADSPIGPPVKAVLRVLGRSGR